MSTPTGIHIPLNYIQLGAKKGTAPTRVLLLRDGDIGWAGLEGFEMNAEVAANVIDEFESHGAKVPIDYHHHTDKAERGLIPKAPAVAWITRLEYVEGEGLYAAGIEWVNDEAKAEVESGQYRYISPSLYPVKGKKEFAQLHSVALVTRPRTIDAPELLAAAAQLTEETNMPDPKGKTTISAQDPPTPDGEAPALDSTQKAMADLMAALGAAGVALDPAASMAAVLIAATEFVQANSEGEPTEEEESPEEEASKKDDDMSTEEATLKAKAASYDSLKGAHEDLQKRMAVIEGEKKALRIDSLIEEAISANKINPNDQDHIAACRALAEKDEEAFATLVGSMPVYAPSESVTRSSADTPADKRGKLIAAAASEYDKDPEQAMGASKESWINAALDQERESDLTAAELETLKGGSK